MTAPALVAIVVIVAGGAAWISGMASQANNIAGWTMRDWTTTAPGEARNVLRNVIATFMARALGYSGLALGLAFMAGFIAGRL